MHLPSSSYTAATVSVLKSRCSDPSEPIPTATPGASPRESGMNHPLHHASALAWLQRNKATQYKKLPLRDCQDNLRLGAVCSGHSLMCAFLPLDNMHAPFCGVWGEAAQPHPTSSGTFCSEIPEVDLLYKRVAFFSPVGRWPGGDQSHKQA